VCLLIEEEVRCRCALRDFIVKFEREHDCLVKSVHADNAAELTGGDFNSCLREQGIKFTSSAPYSLESNGLAENFNKVLFARARCLLNHSGMDKVMRGEAAHHAIHLLNITPSRSLGNITPHEAAYGVVPDVSKLRVFAVSPLQRSHIPRSSTTRQCALPTWVTLVTECIVCCCRDPTTRYSLLPL
jgi:hypothetical protein